jgi:deoxyribodipyrimidine photolyase-related protein
MPVQRSVLGFQRNANSLAKNPRIGMAYRQLEKMDTATVAEFQKQAKIILENIDTL